MADERPDYTSRVPHYTFSTTLAEQEAELATNPLLARMNACRDGMADDPHRPIYHYVNPEGGLNDPNGLCYWGDKWHMFYQAYPPEDTRQHWGHCISDDLIHWRDLPYAIYPDPEECCYSGATLVEQDRVIAMYHGTKVGNMVAVSSDPLLLNWEKVTGQAVVPMTAPDASELPYRVFDPCIWRKDGVYYSLSGGTVPFTDDGRHSAADFLLRSDDLETWEYLHPFVENDRFTLVGDDGACPYFWPIGDKHILLFVSHMSGAQYFLGGYDTKRDKLVATTHGKFNFGALSPVGVHAPSATPDGDGGVIVLFNMNDGISGKEWNQIMTLPRRLTLTGPNELGQEPAGDIESLRADHVHVDGMTLPANQDVMLNGVSGNALEVVAEIDPMGAPTIEMDVLRSPDSEEYTRISFFPEVGLRRDGLWEGRRNGVISLDVAHSSLLPDARTRPPETAQVRLDEGETLKLRVFVDRSVVEVFVNGKQCVAARVYPGREDSVGVSLCARGRDARLVSLDAWQMRSIYA